MFKIENKEAASKPWGAGVNTFVKMKYRRRRSALIQSALSSPDIRDCFTYPEHVFNLSRAYFASEPGDVSNSLYRRKSEFCSFFGKSSLDQPDSTETIRRVFLEVFDFKSP